MEFSTARVLPDPLGELPHQYWDVGSIRDFMEAAAPWIMDYCARRLDSDPDILGDFFVYFYERAETCLETYKSHQHIPFTGYLATYLRHQYMNFMRPRLYNRVAEFAVGDIYEADPSMYANPDAEPPEVKGESTLKPGGGLRAKELDRLNESLEKLSLEMRLPVKLFYGINLNRGELRAVVENSSSPAGAAEFMLEFNRRREALTNRLTRLRHRAAHLDYLIHSNPVRPGIKAGPVKWKRWKHRILKTINGERAVFSRADIAVLLGVNRSTISRRLERAEQFLRTEVS